MKVNVGGVEAMLDAIEGDIQAAVRPAAQAGAEVIYRAVMKNVQAIGKVTGNLSSAIYQVYSEDNSAPGKATYHVSWNQKKAPHGQLVEFGHIQRYAVRMAEDGNWYTLVRPSMRGKPKPRRRASQAERDAYYVPRKGGPQQIAAQPFMRPAYARRDDAVAAVRSKFLDILGAR